MALLFISVDIRTNAAEKSVACIADVSVRSLAYRVYKSERTNERTEGQTNGQSNGRTRQHVDGQTDVLKNRRVDKRDRTNLQTDADGQKAGRADGRADEQMDGFTDVRTGGRTDDLQM